MMPTENPAEQIERLSAQIRRHNHLYFELSAPEIADDEYDALFRRLQALEARHPELLRADSPTQTVGAPPTGAQSPGPVRAEAGGLAGAAELGGATATADLAPPADSATVTHVAPMLSLDSAHDVEAVARFDERMRKALPDQEIGYVVQPKLDGASLELVYANGVLDRAATRGNGHVGDRVTDNVRTIGSVPQRLSGDQVPVPSVLAVRGEAVIYLSDFAALNRPRIEAADRARDEAERAEGAAARARAVAEGADGDVEAAARRAEEAERLAADARRQADRAARRVFKNPRNVAAGAVRQIDPAVTARRPLTVLAFDVMAVEGVDFDTDSERLAALKAWGLRTPERMEVVHSVDEIARYRDAFDADRARLDYEIDGIVVKLNALVSRKELGSTSHHPRWALAYKFAPRRRTARIATIAVSVGRTGAITPVAHLENDDPQEGERPEDGVQLGGVMVSRASLHNREELDRKDVRPGDLVLVQRAGDVIPQVVKRIEEAGRQRAPAFEMPVACPSCGARTVERGPVTACPNHFGCRAQLEGRIVHFGSRRALDVEGLGPRTVQALIDEGLVGELADLFDLTAEQLIALDRFAKVSANNLVRAIQSRRRVELARFLAGLGIPEVGPAVARDLALHFGGIDPIRSAAAEELEAVDGVGPTMAAAIRGFLDEPRVADALDRLLEKDFRLIAPAGAPAVRPGEGRGGGGEGGGPDAAADSEPDAWTGRRVVVTGSLEAFTRSELKALLENRGARVIGSVSGRTDLLVAGARAGSKLKRARALGVEVVNEEELLRRLAPGGRPRQPDGPDAETLDPEATDAPRR